MKHKADLIDLFMDLRVIKETRVTKENAALTEKEIMKPHYKGKLAPSATVIEDQLGKL